MIRLVDARWPAPFPDKIGEPRAVEVAAGAGGALPFALLLRHRLELDEVSLCQNVGEILAGAETPLEYVDLAGEDEDPLVVPAVVKGEDAFARVQFRHPAGAQNHIVATLQENEEL